jgi:hypothetical protein
MSPIRLLSKNSCIVAYARKWEVVYLCLYSCYVSETPERISIKFGSGCVRHKLSDEFSFGSCWSNEA